MAVAVTLEEALGSVTITEAVLATKRRPPGSAGEAVEV